MYVYAPTYNICFSFCSVPLYLPIMSDFLSIYTYVGVNSCKIFKSHIEPTSSYISCAHKRYNVVYSGMQGKTTMIYDIYTIDFTFPVYINS